MQTITDTANAAARLQNGNEPGVHSIANAAKIYPKTQVNMLSELHAANGSRPRILILDDEDLLLSIVQKQLQPEGFDVTAVNEPNQALELLQQESFSVVVADEEMTRMSGLKFFEKLADSHPLIARVILTSNLELNTLQEALKSDLIHRFVTKPWLREELVVAMRNALARHWFCVEHQALTSRHLSPTTSLNGTGRSAAPIGEVLAAIPADLISIPSDSPSNNEAVDSVTVFLKMLYTYHPNVGNTALRATAMCRSLGETLSLSLDQQRSLLWAAALHDISLVGVDRCIVRRWLRSPDKCSKEELAIIKKHPARSQQMLETFPKMKEAGEIIRSHHENWDGTGYPDGLRGEMIPWLSRLLSVVVNYCSKHNANPRCILEIKAKAERMFDPEAIEAVANVAPVTTLPLGEREVLLTELKAGMVLADDIHRNGFLILAKGKELREAAINKVLSINRITPIDPVVLVYC
jgi:response regulator RpfG family c-di-GMP phosphodiesterase